MLSPTSESYQTPAQTDAVETPYLVNIAMGDIRQSYNDADTGWFPPQHFCLGILICLVSLPDPLARLQGVLPIQIKQSVPLMERLFCSFCGAGSLNCCIDIFFRVFLPPLRRSLARLLVFSRARKRDNRLKRLERERAPPFSIAQRYL